MISFFEGYSGDRVRFEARYFPKNYTCICHGEKGCLGRADTEAVLDTMKVPCCSALRCQKIAAEMVEAQHEIQKRQKKKQ